MRNRGRGEGSELVISADLRGLVAQLQADGLDKQQILKRIAAGHVNPPRPNSLSRRRK